ncbi:TRAP transporter large permease [Halomonas sp. HAL1]|jgi:tripartite ATP-independent transporter DctM subunit|uniref:TRAP transporter large permease n=1 Tax=Halomonas sp. HAL1 TaxID=550984 RepID=UPI00022D31B1|nr:TRAP transporter large permease [Halomonas sp. HAL1]EHA16452.1 TRAP-type C4-dicarboxylate transport system, large permease component [Halomonas sp. HAL1]WKV92714.1 TRAP transporter large permease [Halomonas sp. HAL1]
MIEALYGFAALLILVFMRVPLAFAMGIVGFVGFYYLTGNWNAAEAMASRRVVDTAMDYGLSVIPLFILMGNLVSHAGLSDALFRASNGFLGHRKGGQAMATIVACGGFSAICGSSLATCATMGRVAMPQMRKYGYKDSLAAASIAAGGTLGILIPPSVMLVIYGIITETSIRELFAAGFIPGMLGIVMYLGAVKWVLWRDPSAGPAAEKVPWSERFSALKNVGSTLALFVLVIGGIYLGIFTPTEAAGIGAMGAFVIALLKRALTPSILMNVLMDTVRTTAMLFAVVLTALIFANFINRAGLPNDLLALVNGLNVAPFVVILVILAIYVLLGCVFESMSMMLLTVPVFFPVVAGLGYDLVWFGILVVIVIEISLITPPVGMNVFVLRAVLPDVSTGTIFRGVTPFWVAGTLRAVLVLIFPGIVLFLPQLLY